MDAELDFLWSAVPAGLFAGTVAVCVTVAIERWGGRVGGLIGALPSTVIPASLGIYAESADVAAFENAMDAIPWAMVLNALFLLLWRVLPPRLPQGSLLWKLTVMTVVSMSCWWVGAVSIVHSTGAWLDAGGSSLLMGTVGILVLVSVGIGACLNNPPTPKGHRAVPKTVLLMRAVFAGLSIFVTVWIASVGGAVASGVASAFPAIFWTSMAALWISQGQSVPSGAVGPMMLGSSSVAAFALFARFTLPAFGYWLGAVMAWVGAVLVITVPAWRWLARRAEATEN